MQAAYAHFGFSANPFAITPDPHFLYLSPLHKEGLAHLMYGMREGGGFVQLTGEVGTGKTTLYRSVLEQLPDGVDVALILNPKQSARELLASVCDELQIAYDAERASIKDLVDRLNRFLLAAHAAGRRVVLIIDEAQDLDPDVLEQIRLLTNLETAEQKLLLVVLVGQPELRDLLGRGDMRQLAQRVTARYHLMPLSQDETAEYIEHRQFLAEGAGGLFSAAAVRIIFRMSGGVPRLINVICERALIAAYAEQCGAVDARIARRAGREVMDGNSFRQPRRSAALILVATGLVLAVLAAVGGYIAHLEGLPVLPVPGSGTPPAVATTGARGSAAAEPALPARSAAPDGQPGPGLPGLLERGAIQSDTQTALRTLFALWGRQYDTLPGAVACDRAAAAGLNCQTGTDGLAALRRFNRAAVIELLDQQGGRHHLVLSRLGPERVSLMAGEIVREAPLDELLPLWSGVYLLLTHPSPVDEVLRLGSRGEAVTWLRRQLALAEGGQPETDPAPLFDRELERRIQGFQRRHGLADDGVVGAQTLQILLSMTRADTEPLLLPPAA